MLKQEQVVSITSKREPEVPERLSDPQRRTLPVCPYCKTDPIPLGTVPVGLGPLTALVVFCCECRNTINVLPLGLAQPEPSRIVTVN